MKNNTAMNFCNSIANLQLLTAEQCNRTGQNSRDGYRWHIEKDWKGIKILSYSYYEDTLWQFEDNSVVLCEGDASILALTEIIHVTYIGRMGDGTVRKDSPRFWPGCTYHLSGYFKDGAYIEPEPLPMEQAPERLPSKNVIAPTTKPEGALKFIRAALAAHASADEFAQNHALALAYLEQRKADVKSFNEREVLTWVNRNSGKYASIYGKSVAQEYTALEREKNPNNWGAVTVYKEGGQEDRIIQMKSYECLVAWILAKYW